MHMCKPIETDRFKASVISAYPSIHTYIHIYTFICTHLHFFVGGLGPDELDRIYDSGSLGASALDNMGSMTFFANIGRAGTRALSVASLQRPVTRTGQAHLHTYILHLSNRLILTSIHA